MVIEKNKKIDFKYILGAYAVILMLLCAGSSPLVEYLSPDSSIFYTMGRSAANGTVLYKEIADHKGFYLFAFNWLGAWLTPGSMNGLLLVEILFAWIKLVFVYEIAKLYVIKKKNAFLVSVAFMVIATNFLSWNTGNLGEQFALAFQLISMYYIAKYLKCYELEGKFKEHNWQYMFVHGLVAGIVLFIQANLIAMWIPFGVGLAIVLIKNRYIKNFLHNLYALFAGVGIAFLPVLLYGLVNDCVEDMYYVMFEINFMYSADGRNGKNVLVYLADFICSPSGIIVLLAIVGVAIVCKYYKEIHICITGIGMLVFSIICMSVSLNPNPIYYTVYIPFIIPFLIWLSKFSRERWILLECLILLGMTVICNLQLVKKVLHLGSSGYAYESAYQMKELIEDKEANVLVLGNCMYYNCTDTLPHIKYFTIFGSGLKYETFPYCIDEQFDSLCSLENEYIMIEYKDNGYSFWDDEQRNRTMNHILEKNYDLKLEYNAGGIHSALWQKSNQD